MRLTCKTLHRRHVPSMLLKLDIARAFDSVCWTFLLEVLRVLNGALGRHICHARGLRQGDPLSPLLFVLVMEAFNLSFQWMDREYMFTRLPGLVKRISLYADDVVVFLAPVAHDLLSLRSLLQLLGQASGLFTNLAKCVATPLHCSEEMVAAVQQVLSCRVEHFPSKYLGIPLSIFRFLRASEQSLTTALRRGSLPGKETC